MSSAGADAFETDTGLEIVDYYRLQSEQTDFSSCAPDDARVFGIDRGNKNTGTQVDESLLQHVKNYNVGTNRITFDPVETPFGRVVPVLHPSYEEVWRSRLGYDRAGYVAALSDALDRDSR